MAELESELVVAVEKRHSLRHDASPLLLLSWQHLEYWLQALVVKFGLNQKHGVSQTAGHYQSISPNEYHLLDCLDF